MLADISPTTYPTPVSVLPTLAQVAVALLAA